MTLTPNELNALAERVEALAGPDREVDAEIAENFHGWKLAKIGPDYDGENACEILTPDGRLYGNGFQYPPRGKLPRYYHVSDYTRDCRDPALAKGAVRALLAADLRARAASLLTGEEK